jgi:CzcA family heavy metal efflux pump
MNTSRMMQNRVKSILFVVAALSLAGLFNALRLPVALFPDVAFPRIVVSADAGDMPADRMMITVTRPLEEAVHSIPDVVNVRSTTSRGASELSINFHWNIDMIKAELQVNNAINQIKGDLPAALRFQARKMNPTVFPILGYSLISKQRSLTGLRNFAELNLRPVLTSIDGVANVIVVGGRTKEYEVLVNPERLRSFQLSLTKLVQAVQNANIIAAAGKIDQDYKLNLTLVDGQYTSAENIGNTIVKIHHQMPVFLDDVAVIREATVPEWTRVTSNGQEAVLLNIYQQPGGNTVQIDTQIKQTLADMKDRIPADITLSKFYDQSDLILDSMKSVRDSIIVGIVLAVAILLVFLRNWKITAIATLDLPLTLAVTMLAMSALGMSFNIMTLGGMAAAIGLIIDDAIVVVENIIRHLAMRQGEARKAVEASLQEIFKPLLGSSFSTIVVFAPLAFLTGVTGAFFKSLSLTMACSLLVSLLLSIFFIPILSQRFISERDAEKQEKPSRLFTYLERGYETALRFLLRRRHISFIVAAVLIVLSYLLYRGLPSGFLPEMDEGTFILDYRTEAGTSLEETDRVVKQIEAILTEIPEVASYSRRTGLQLGGGLTEANMGDFLIRLNAKRSRGIDKIIDDVRQKVLDRVPGIEIEFAQLMGDLIGDLTAVPQPIEIKIFGDNFDQIHQIAEKVVEVIQQVRGVVDIYNGVTIAGSSLDIKVDPLRAGLFGLNTNDVQQEVEAAINGIVASEMQERQFMTGIRIHLPVAETADLEKIKRLRLLTSSGDYTSLASVADLSIHEGQPELNRESLKQMIAVTARISNRDMGSTLRDIQASVGKEITLPQSVYIKYGGLYREQQNSFKGLLIVLVMAVVLVFIVQMFEFESFRLPLVILLVSLLSLFGVFLSLRLTGIPLNISSMMGMIMIIGIVAENAIFLVHYIGLEKSAGLSHEAALVEAGKVRMRPIIMTTLAAVLALTPLAIGIGAGAQMQQPLAVAVIGGFSFSAILLLFMLPVFYAAFFHNSYK